MCFSVEASFGASIIISTIGVVSLKKANHTPYRLLAMMPIFFGIQQFAEGIVWLAAEYEQFSYLLDIGAYGFILFAWIIWPLYIPYSLMRLEGHLLRKRIMSYLQYIGILVALVLLYIMLHHELRAEIKDLSILYSFDFHHSGRGVFGVFYLMATVLPPLISTIRKMWLLGVLNLLTYFIAKVYFKEHIISIWCFFAALTSILILWIIIIKANSKSKS